jgi:hypothetical protein
MVVKAGTKLGNKVNLLDSRGKVVSGAISYNTRTKEATVLLLNKDGRFVVGSDGVVKTKVKIPGSKLVYKKSGRQVK